jgi:flagellar FliJ protein
MPKFVFSLESVLRHRTFVEQERLRDLAVAQAETTRLQGELKALNDAMQAGSQDMKANHLTGSLDVAYLAAHRRYTVATQRKGMMLVQEMARQQRKVNEAQRLLAEAAKERKVLEKLRERHQERWAQEVQRKELAELDEVGMQLSYRQTREEVERENEEALSAGAAAKSLAVSQSVRGVTAKPHATPGAIRRNEVDAHRGERERRS